MKLQTVISITLLAMIAALSINVQAAETDSAKPVAEATMAQDHASMPQSAASAPAAKKHAAQDKSKHFHPRDGK